MRSTGKQSSSGKWSYMKTNTVYKFFVNDWAMVGARHKLCHLVLCKTSFGIVYNGRQRCSTMNE